jgi:hypothetical protein
MRDPAIVAQVLVANRPDDHAVVTADGAVMLMETGYGLD